MLVGNGMYVMGTRKGSLCWIFLGWVWQRLENGRMEEQDRGVEKQHTCLTIYTRIQTHIAILIDRSMHLASHLAFLIALHLHSLPSLSTSILTYSSSLPSSLFPFPSPFPPCATNRSIAALISSSLASLPISNFFNNLPFSSVTSPSPSPPV